MLINAQGIELFYGERLILQFGSLKVYRGDRIGIVGGNGAGKTTLLDILTERLAPDCGSVDVRGAVAYCSQLGTESDGKPDALNGGIFGTNDGVSGGEIVRRKLAAAFSKSFDVLALDEPTSNLDFNGIETLTAMLGGVETLLLISHDRRLLAGVCNKIIEVKDGGIKVYGGGLDVYLQESERQRIHDEFLYDEYISEKKRLERAALAARERASQVKKTPSRMGNSEARLHRREATGKQGKIMTAGSAMLSRAHNLKEVVRSHSPRLITPDFAFTDPPKNRIIFSCDTLNFAYGAHVIFENAEMNIAGGAHVAITGGNGVGKTTLLRLIAEGNEMFCRAPKARVGYLAQDFSELDLGTNILTNVLADAVQPQSVCRGVLAGMGFFGDDVYKKVAALSGGELVKASIARLIVSACNVLVLDEPTNYLDMDSIARVQAALTAYAGTLIFVSHDRDFVSAVADTIFEIRNKKIITKNSTHFD